MLTEKLNSNLLGKEVTIYFEVEISPEKKGEVVIHEIVDEYGDSAPRRSKLWPAAKKLILRNKGVRKVSYARE